MKKNTLKFLLFVTILGTGICLSSCATKQTADNIAEKYPDVSWKEAPSLAEAYKDYFDYIGFATPKGGVLELNTVQEGLAHQASCFTMENEFKPDFMFAWKTPGDFREFIAEDGNSYKVPSNTPVTSNIGTILGIAMKNNLKMRGHVLVWHSQTPDWFFRRNYGSKSEPLVEPEEMNARMEWYIKTILEYVKDWEEKYNGGKRIVITWDVVNEAASDSANGPNFLRSDSNWFRIYKNDSFIINAFRYANKYAPADVKLAYNDYNCAMGNKTQAIMRIIKDIQETPDARIDIAGMQTHVGMYTPVTGMNSTENAIKKFISLGVDVQITEMDIALDGTTYNPEKLLGKYKEYFTMFLNNRKTKTKHGVCGVTLWGTTDERSWIYHSGNGTNYPLLFNGNYKCKPAFYGVLEAAREFQGE